MTEKNNSPIDLFTKQTKPLVVLYPIICNRWTGFSTIDGLGKLDEVQSRIVKALG